MSAWSLGIILDLYAMKVHIIMRRHGADLGEDEFREDGK